MTCQVTFEEYLGCLNVLCMLPSQNQEQLNTIKLTQHLDVPEEVYFHSEFQETHNSQIEFLENKRIEFRAENRPYLIFMKTQIEEAAKILLEFLADICLELVVRQNLSAQDINTISSAIIQANGKISSLELHSLLHKEEYKMLVEKTIESGCEKFTIFCDASQFDNSFELTQAWNENFVLRSHYEQVPDSTVLKILNLWVTGTISFKMVVVQHQNEDPLASSVQEYNGIEEPIEPSGSHRVIRNFSVQNGHGKRLLVQIRIPFVKKASCLTVFELIGE